MCSEFSFYLQFATFMMLLATVPLSMMCVKLMENTPVSDDWSELRARMIYRLAGKADQWFSEQDITIFSARKP